MLRPQSEDFVAFGRDDGPFVLVVVDTEEEFDWGAPFSTSATNVATIRHQERGQRVLERHGVIPTYVVDYPVASQEEGFGPLGEILADGKCAIGTHLHPWVSPPVEEEITVANSYPGNLPRALELEKLRRLTLTIEDNFGTRPTIYKAGRYGIGPNTAGILAELDYEIDVSVYARTDLTPKDGPDFRHASCRPYWFGPEGRLLEIPLTIAMVGALSGLGPDLYPRITKPLGMRLRIPGIFSRLGILERIALTPEGVTLTDAKRLTRILLDRGHRVFTIAYHSPSMAPGHTPYVRSDSDLTAFLAWIDEYLAFFMGELGGHPSTPAALLQKARRARNGEGAPANQGAATQPGS